MAMVIGKKGFGRDSVIRFPSTFDWILDDGRQQKHALARNSKIFVKILISCWSFIYVFGLDSEAQTKEVPINMIS